MKLNKVICISTEGVINAFLEAIKEIEKRKAKPVQVSRNKVER